MGADADNVFFRGERSDFMPLPVIMKHILILHPTVVVLADAEKLRIGLSIPFLRAGLTLFASERVMNMAK